MTTEQPETLLQMAEACESLTKLMLVIPGIDTGVWAKTLREANERIEAQGREVARLREVNAEQYGALDLAARECTTLRAELAAIRAQEPVGFVSAGYLTLGEGRISEHATGVYKVAVYAPLADKDAGLVADGWKLVPDADREDWNQAIRCVFITARKHDNTVPSHWLDAMRDYLLAASPKIGGV